MQPDLLAMMDGETVMEETNLTASKTDMNVIDLDAFGKAGGHVNGVLLMVHIKTKTTLDASNYLSPEIHEADAKTSDTALTSGANVNAAERIPETLTVLNGDVAAGDDIFYHYRGVKSKIQLQFAATGSPDAVISVTAFAKKDKMDHVGMS